MNINQDDRDPDPDFEDRQRNETDIYRVDENEHGHPQYMQEDPQGDFPVCSSCNCCVAVNRGQGTDCDKCQHEAFIEMEHDYNDGLCY